MTELLSIGLIARVGAAHHNATKSRPPDRAAACRLKVCLSKSSAAFLLNCFLPIDLMLAFGPQVGQHQDARL